MQQPRQDVPIVSGLWEPSTRSCRYQERRCHVFLASRPMAGRKTWLQLRFLAPEFLRSEIWKKNFVEDDSTSRSVLTIPRCPRGPWLQCAIY